MKNEERTDKFTGCLMGGAIGDALGYPLEFMKYEDIISKYGKTGITKYELNNGVAIISDDTQMTLFTAEGILFGVTRGNTRGITGSLENYIYFHYMKWLETQNIKVKPNSAVELPNSWLANIPELNQRREPGNTCLSALMSGKQGNTKEPINDSKGCGSVMRIAPVGLHVKPNNKVFELGMEVGAITHGHPMGYLSSGLFALIISKIIYEENKNLEEIITESLNALDYYPNNLELKEIINKAINLSKQDIKDEIAIVELGEGWVAEEALAIAIYSSLKYNNDFKKAIICSVNHSGDSDSTGSITGNIIGAYLGLSKIPNEYLENLELKDIILEIAKDLSINIPVSECGDNNTEEAKIWFEKYLYGTYKYKE